MLSREFTAKELDILSSGFFLELPEDVQSVSEHMTKCTYPNIKLKGYLIVMEYSGVEFVKEGGRMKARLNLDAIKKIAKNPRFKRTTKFSFRINYLVK